MWYRLLSRQKGAHPGGCKWAGAGPAVQQPLCRRQLQLSNPLHAFNRKATWSVATVHRPPYMFVDQETGSFTGLLVELLPLLFMEAGYSTTASSFSYYAAPTNSGGSLKNGSWNGAPGLDSVLNPAHIW